MTAILFAAPPLMTPDLPGLGGRLKVEPEDFDVEEIPAYEPSGEGDHLFLWIEKRGMGAEFFVRQVARRLGLPNGAVGTAGLKDRHAVTRQWVSVPAEVEPQLGQLDSAEMRVLKTSRHGNKLKPGHLRGNRFRILVRDSADVPFEPILERIREQGMPNFYGPQRFGRDGETLTLGLSLLKNEPTVKRLNPFLRKLALSAAQSAIFNLYLGQRLQDGLLRRVLPGDVMAKWPFGGMFAAQDVEREQQRFDTRETVSAGPIFGKKTFPALGEAAAREAAVLTVAEIPLSAFRNFGKLLLGTRRHNLVYLDDLSAAREPHGVRFSFSLPAGSYATVLMREIMKADDALAHDDDPDA